MLNIDNYKYKNIAIIFAIGIGILFNTQIAQADVVYDSNAGILGLGDNTTSDDAQTSGTAGTTSATVGFAYKHYRKVAFGCRAGDNSPPNHPFFANFPTVFPNTYRSTVYDGTSAIRNGYNRTKQVNRVNCILYTNSENTYLSATITDYYHETDPNSIIVPGTYQYLDNGLRLDYKDDTGRYTVEDARIPKAWGPSNLATSLGRLDLVYMTFWNADTIDITDMGGTYTGIINVSITLL